MRREEREDERNGGRELFYSRNVYFISLQNLTTQWVNDSLLMRDDESQQRTNIFAS